LYIKCFGIAYLNLSDFPGKSGDDGWLLDPTNSRKNVDVKSEGGKYPDILEKNVRLDESIFSDGRSTVLGIAVGSILMLIAVMVAVLCGIIWKRRKNHSGYATSDQLAKSSLGQPSENCLLTMQTRRPDDPLPDITRHDGGTHAEIMPSVLYGSMQRPARSVSPPQPVTPGLQRSGTSSFAPNVQQQEWDRMLVVESLRHDDVMVSSITSNSDLPPPPAFLLESEQNVASTSDTVTTSSKTHTGVKCVDVKAALFLDEILDGYISGDNVDDDIDQVDFTIRIPSIHNKMCDI